MNIKISEKAVSHRFQNNKKNTKTIGEYIRKERLTQGLKQEFVCKDICSVSYYSRIERNEVDPSNEYISKIFQKLNKQIPSDLTSVDQEKNKEVINRFLTAIEYRNKSLIEDEYANLQKCQLENKDLYEFIYYIHHRKLNDIIPYIQKLHSQQIYFSNEELLLYLENLGIYYVLLKEINRAKDYLGLAIQLQTHMKITKPGILYRYAWVLGKLNIDLKCIEYAEEADKIFIENHNIHRSIECQLLVAIKYSKYFPMKAKSIYEKIIGLCKRNKYNKNLKICRYNLALLLKKNNFIKEAKELFLELINKYEEDIFLKLDIYVEFIDLLLIYYSDKEAMYYYNKLKEYPISNDKYNLYIEYYGYRFNDSDLDSKISAYNQVFIPYSKKIGNKSLEVRFRKEYAILLEESKCLMKCIDQYKKIIDLQKNYRY